VLQSDIKEGLADHNLANLALLTKSFANPYSKIIEEIIITLKGASFIQELERIKDAFAEINHSIEFA
jgi:ribosomal protein S8